MTFPCPETTGEDRMPIASLFVTPNPASEGDTYTITPICIDGDAPVTQTLEQSLDGGITWTPTAPTGTVTSTMAAVGNVLFRVTCTDADGDTSTDTVTMVVAGCLPVTIATNPTNQCGSLSGQWRVASSPAGPWTQSATRWNETCSPLGGPSPVPGASWIGPATQPPAAGQYCYRDEFVLNSAQAAGLQSGTLTLRGDSSITSVEINGVSIYSGTPPNDFSQNAGPIAIPAPSGLIAGVNTLIVCQNADGTVFDGIVLNLELSCDPYVAPVCDPTWLEDTLLQHPAPPESLAPNLVPVANETQLANAINNAGPGTHIQATQNFNINSNHLYQNINGTAVAPILIDGNGFTLTVTGGVKPFQFGASSWVYFYDWTLDANGQAIWAFILGAVAGNPVTGANNNFYIYGNEIHSPRQEILKISQCDTVEVVGNNLYDPGRNPQAGGASNFCEIVYFGDGNGGTLTNRVINGLVENNWIHDTAPAQNGITPAGEGIDVKRPSQNIVIRRNLVENIRVNSQGAVTLVIDCDTVNNVGDYNILAEENYIRNVRTKAGGFNGDGITAAKGATTIRRNIIQNVDGDGVRTLLNVTSSNKSIEIQDNTILGAGGGAIVTNQGNAGQGCNLPATISRCGNATDDGTGDVQVTAAAFVGPLTTSSGFAPAAGSVVIDNGGCTATDLSGIPIQGAGRDAGAVEYCP